MDYWARPWHKIAASRLCIEVCCNAIECTRCRWVAGVVTKSWRFEAMQGGLIRLGPGTGYGTLTRSVVWQGILREGSGRSTYLDTWARCTVLSWAERLDVVCRLSNSYYSSNWETKGSNMLLSQIAFIL